MNLTFHGDPRSKKNSQQIIRIGNRPMIIPSKKYKEYEKACRDQIKGMEIEKICDPVNIKCVYYMQTRRRVDLVNLIEATNDILVNLGILEDDNSQIVVSHDGSRVDYDKADPRVEIEITGV